MEGRVEFLDARELVESSFLESANAGSRSSRVSRCPRIGRVEFWVRGFDRCLLHKDPGTAEFVSASIHPSMGPKRSASAAGFSGPAPKKPKQATLTRAGKVQPPPRPRAAAVPPPDKDQDGAARGGAGSGGEEAGRDEERRDGQESGDDEAVDVDQPDAPKGKGKRVARRKPAACYTSGCWEWVKDEKTGQCVLGLDGKKQVVCRLCRDAFAAGYEATLDLLCDGAVVLMLVLPVLVSWKRTCHRIPFRRAKPPTRIGTGSGTIGTTSGPSASPSSRSSELYPMRSRRSRRRSRRS